MLTLVAVPKRPQYEPPFALDQITAFDWSARLSLDM
jgi:hypothetical protein